PEILYKIALLRGHVEEIPAHLDWSVVQRESKAPRRISFAVNWHILSILFSGFVFRPLAFFIFPGFALLGVSSVLAFWICGHISHYWSIAQSDLPGPLNHLSAAMSLAYQNHGHVFFLLSVTSLVALQFITLGVLATQNKRYFEELFHQGTRLRTRQS
ncbi:MAG: hypothetical protein AAF191_21155, partial [Verrucomicrobiota bacterium]